MKMTPEIEKLRELEEHFAGQPRIHTKTGTLYSVEGVAMVQASDGDIYEGDYVVVYFNENGDMFVRKVEEFEKRFRELNDDDIQELGNTIFPEV